MAKLPYVTSPGNIAKALEGIKSAAVPQRISQDFVKTILKIPGGSGDQITTFLKKIGFTDHSGSPSELYKKFRNPTSSGHAIAQAIRNAYAPLYIRNEFMHKLGDSDLVGLVVEETGEAHDANNVKLIVSCIKQLKEFANFDEMPELIEDTQRVVPREIPDLGNDYSSNSQDFKFNLGYTINLNLPATSDPAVFDAIFKSLKDNLLRKDDV